MREDRIRRFYLLFLLLAAAGTLYGQKATEQSFLEAFRKAQSPKQSGSSDKALPLWKKAVELAETLCGKKHANTAAAYVNLASSLAPYGD